MVNKVLQRRAATEQFAAAQHNFSRGKLGLCRHIGNSTPPQ
jgi:hypothetical protein